MVEMQPDGTGLIGDEVKIFDGNENDQVTIEGPKMYKRNGWYLYLHLPEVLRLDGRQFFVQRMYLDLMSTRLLCVRVTHL